MLKVTLTNEILNYITGIDKNRYEVASIEVPRTVANRLRKNSKKKSSYASTKIEGNPLTENQADEAIEFAKQHEKEIIKNNDSITNHQQFRYNIIVESK